MPNREFLKNLLFVAYIVFTTAMVINTAMYVDKLEHRLQNVEDALTSISLSKGVDK